MLRQAPVEFESAADVPLGSLLCALPALLATVPERKHFTETIKLIAYRTETALVGTVLEALARNDDGRALVRELLRTTVRLHPLPSRLQDQAVRAPAEELTRSFPAPTTSDWLSS